MGRGRLLTGEFKKESYPIKKTPSHVHRSTLPTPTRTLQARAGGISALHHLCAGSYPPRHSCTVMHRRPSAGARSESQASPLPFLCYAHASARAACMHSYVQILSHSHIPGHPCVLLHSPSLSSLLTYIHPLAYRWPHLTASHMLPQALWVPVSLLQPSLPKTHGLAPALQRARVQEGQTLELSSRQPPKCSSAAGT